MDDATPTQLTDEEIKKAEWKARFAALAPPSAPIQTINVNKADIKDLWGEDSFFSSLKGTWTPTGYYPSSLSLQNLPIKTLPPYYSNHHGWADADYVWDIMPHWYKATEDNTIWKWLSSGDCTVKPLHVPTYKASKPLSLDSLASDTVQCSYDSYYGKYCGLNTIGYCYYAVIDGKPHFGPVKPWAKGLSDVKAA